MMLGMNDAYYKATRDNLKKLINPLESYKTDRDPKLRERYKRQKKYVDNGYLDEDLDAMRAIRKSNPKQRYQVAPPIKLDNSGTYIWDVGQGVQKGGSRTSFAESFLTLLSLEIKSHGKEPETFVKNAEDTINDMGQVPLVKEFIGKLFDDIKLKQYEGYTFAHFKGEIGPLEEAFHANFSESEISVLKELSAPTVFYSAVPEEYENILGHGAYSLSGEPSASAEGEEEIDLNGLDEEIVLTKEERASLEKGGIPLGALIFLYFVCFKMSNSTA
jgi:hypothetical protein